MIPQNIVKLLDSSDEGDRIIGIKLLTDQFSSRVLLCMPPTRTYGSGWHFFRSKPQVGFKPIYLIVKLGDHFYWAEEGRTGISIGGLRELQSWILVCEQNPDYKYVEL